MRRSPSNYKNLLPEYPRTLHLPHKPNASREDLIADQEDVKDIFDSDNVYVEEKVDGANCAMMLYDDEPLIRNRSHILVKGYNKATPAKAQFASIWNWFYSNKDKFSRLNDILGINAGVCGEWMYALHGIRYNSLPDLFLVYDVYDSDRGIYLETGFARESLEKASFSVVPLLHKGKVKDFDQLEHLCEETSPFSMDRREGVYVKVTDGLKVIKRFKMVRRDFIQGCHWSKKSITRNGTKNAQTKIE